MINIDRHSIKYLRSACGYNFLQLLFFVCFWGVLCMLGGLITKLRHIPSCSASLFFIVHYTFNILLSKQPLLLDNSKNSKCSLPNMEKLCQTPEETFL